MARLGVYPLYGFYPRMPFNENESRIGKTFPVRLLRLQADFDLDFAFFFGSVTDGFEKPDGLVVSGGKFLEDVGCDLVSFFAHVNALADERTENVEIRLEFRCRIGFVYERAFDVLYGGEFGHFGNAPERRVAELPDAFGYGVDVFSEFVLPGSVESVPFGEVGTYEVPMESPDLRIERVLRSEDSQELFVHVFEINA